MNKKKIFWLSDSPMTVTGYATISKNVLNGLSNKYECHAMAHNYVGQVLPPGITFRDGTKLNFTIHGNGRAGYCQDLISPRLRKYNSDAFVMLLDTFMVYPWILNMDLSPAKTFFYFPSDGGENLPQGCEEILKKVHVPIAMAKFGQKQAIEVHGIKNCEYIPHAVHTDIYYPLSESERNRLKEEFTVLTINGTTIKGLLRDKFVIGTVARNQGRKMLDKTLKSFKKLSEQIPEAILYMHCDPNDSAAVFDIKYLASRLGLENRIVFSDMKFYEGFEYKEMNKVYNVMDVFFLSTSGEGFGVPIIEAMSCEVPVVATDYTTTKELVIDHKAGLAVPLAAEITGSWCVERGIIDENKACEALKLMYDNPTMRKEMGNNGRNAVLKEYDWNIVNKQWEELFERHLK